MAYIIICHKNPKQINKLINKLYEENTDFFIHVDKKSTIQKEIVKLSNVYFVPDPSDIQWGHFSQIECILKSLSTVKEHGKYNYVHIISGQDLPLRSNQEIIQFFKDNESKEFVEYVSIPNHDARYGFLDRVSVYYPKFLTPRTRYISALRRRYVKFVMKSSVLKRKLKDVPESLYKGANWMSITGECMEYILTYVEGHPNYVSFFKHSFCGDEIFFQSIIMNSPFKEHVVNDIKRYIDWETGPDLPRTLTIEDEERLQKNGNQCFWGRKFDSEVDNQIIEKVLTTL